MAKAYTKKIWYRLKLNLLPIILSILLFILAVFTYQVIVADKFYPFTFAGDTNISFLTQGRAIRALQSSFQKRKEQKLTFETFAIDLATSSGNLDYSVLNSAFNQSHGGSLWNRLTAQIQSLLFRSVITPKITLSLDKQLETISQSVDKMPQNAQLFFDEITTPEGSTSTSLSASPSARIQVKEGVDGLALDKKKLEEVVSEFLLTGRYQNQLPLKVVTPAVTTQRALKAKQALEDTLKEPIHLIFNDSNWIIDTKQLLTLLDLETDKGELLDKYKTGLYLEKIASEIDQPVTEGLFEFNPATKRVSAFKPSQEGRKLDIDKTYQLINDTLSNETDGSKTISLPVSIVKPKIETSDVNSLGIKELIGKGISNFTGSIPNRIYNINLTASKINGVLIPPGETFSFNQTIGDITAATGFKQAYVIKEGRTVLDDGGGVCQDSTTLFRAVLNAGLPIIKRTAHAYRVGYYEQGFPPGLDATVFYPSVDFQFKNDTPNHILIQAYTVGTTLYVDLYGTSDGRVASLTKPVVTNQTPPPAELRQDDPALPKGTVKQVDFPAWGATVSFSRTVTRGSETLIKETFKSSYKAWQAVYLVGTKEN